MPLLLWRDAERLRRPSILTTIERARRSKMVRPLGRSRTARDDSIFLEAILNVARRAIGGLGAESAYPEIGRIGHRPGLLGPYGLEVP